MLLDDGSASTNLLINVVRAAHEAHFPVRIIVREENGGRARARNRLLDAARGGYVLFLDADMAPRDPDYLARWIFLIGQEKVGVAFGGLSLEGVRANRETALHHATFAHSDCHGADARQREAALKVATSNLLVRRDILAAEPFDDGFSGWGWEDVDWALRAERIATIRHIDNPAAHTGLDSIETLLRKYAEGGKNYARLAQKHPQAVTRMQSYRAARALKALPGYRAVRTAFAWVARDPLGLTPMAARRAALKLYRAAHMAENLA